MTESKSVPKTNNKLNIIFLDTEVQSVQLNATNSTHAALCICVTSSISLLGINWYSITEKNDNIGVKIPPSCMPSVTVPTRK
jgi:hypothetical protein